VERGTPIDTQQRPPPRDRTYAPPGDLKAIELDFRQRYGGREWYIRKQPDAGKAKPDDA
jgi:hypothetical protein